MKNMVRQVLPLKCRRRAVRSVGSLAARRLRHVVKLAADFGAGLGTGRQHFFAGGLQRLLQGRRFRSRRPRKTGLGAAEISLANGVHPVRTVFRRLRCGQRRFGRRFRRSRRRQRCGNGRRCRHRSGLRGGSARFGRCCRLNGRRHRRRHGSLERCRFAAAGSQQQGGYGSTETQRGHTVFHNGISGRAGKRHIICRGTEAPLPSIGNGRLALAHAFQVASKAA